jgi:hypothetical protein
MLRNLSLALSVIVLLSACARRQGLGQPSQTFPGAQSPSAGNRPVPPPATQARNPEPATSGAIVTPANSRAGRVALVNTSARYVILTYTLGHVPAKNSRLTVYRDGLKVAELQVTEFSRDINTVADIVAGECRVGDEVRDH